MTRVLVLAAVDVEVRRLARLLGLAPVPGEAGWHYRGEAMEMACVGPGAGHLDRAAACGRPDLVVSAGACGALLPGLAAGALVVPERVLDGRGRAWSTWPELPLVRRGALLTTPAVVETPEDKARLSHATGALAVDMESAPILAWAAAHGVPGAVVRGVSDPATRAVPAGLVGLVDPGGRVRASRAVGLLVARPGCMPAMVALARGTALALRAVAGALGLLVRSARPPA